MFDTRDKEKNCIFHRILQMERLLKHVNVDDVVKLWNIRSWSDKRLRITTIYYHNLQD